MRVLLLLAALCLPLPALAQQQATITVAGRGEVAMAPDMATISVGVLREAGSATEAMAGLAEATDSVLARIRDEGVGATDVQTGQLSLHPRWERRDEGGAPRILGYVAETTLTVRVRDLDALGTLLDAVVSDGANQMHGLSFGLQDPRAAQDEARREAFAQAMARAELYAEATGRAVGPVLSITEGGGPAPGPFPTMAMEEARAMPIAPGEVTEAVTVTLVVALGEEE